MGLFFTTLAPTVRARQCCRVAAVVSRWYETGTFAEVIYTLKLREKEGMNKGWDREKRGKEMGSK